MDNNKAPANNSLAAKKTIEADNSKRDSKDCLSGGCSKVFEQSYFCLRQPALLPVDQLDLVPIF